MALWGTRTHNTDARHVVTSQEVLVVTEAEDEVSIFIPFAALRLTVAAVQLHLDLTLAVTLHGWKEQNKHVKTKTTQRKPPELLLRAFSFYCISIKKRGTCSIFARVPLLLYLLCLNT